jgi:hypothetical protein
MGNDDYDDYSKDLNQYYPSKDSQGRGLSWGHGQGFQRLRERDGQRPGLRWQRRRRDEQRWNE